MEFDLDKHLIDLFTSSERTIRGMYLFICTITSEFWEILWEIELKRRGWDRDNLSVQEWDLLNDFVNNKIMRLIKRNAFRSNDFSIPYEQLRIFLEKQAMKGEK